MSGESEGPDCTEFLQKGGVICRVNWEEVGTRAEALPLAERDDFITNVEWAWLKELGESKNLSQKRFETDHHLILSDEVDQPVERFERTFDEINRSVFEYFDFPHGTTASKWGGKMVVLIFSQSDDFVRHLAIFDQESDGYETSGCEYVWDQDHWHMVLHGIDDESLLHSFASHVVRGCLHLFDAPPMWMRVGASGYLTGLVTGDLSPGLTRKSYLKHRSHWNRRKLADFSSEDMLNVPEVGLSFELAMILWEKIDRVLEAKPVDRRALLEKASLDDGGEAALQEIFGISLDDLFRSFLGEKLL